MARTNVFAVSMLVAALTALGHAAPDDRKAGALFQAAEAKATFEGDPKGAIPLYKEAVAEAGSNRVLVARALFGLGEAYRQVDKSAAQETYTRIVREFSEPKDVVAAARARLTAPAPRRQQGDGVATRLVLGADRANVIDVSADGSTAVGMSVGLRSEVLVWNLASGESRVLMPIPAANLGAMKVSPDGRTIAYRWTDTVDGKPVVTVRLMGTEPNAKPRVLSETPAHPAAWSMDGRSVLMLRGENAGPRSLEWMVVADESTRFIKTFESWQNPMTFAVSPDGSIAYSINPRTGSTEDRHIYVVDSAGQSETAVVNAAGLSNFPVWTADGAYLLFSSNKSGAPAVWSVGMRAGRPAGELSVLMPGAMRPVTATRGGAVYFATTNLASFNQLGFVADLEGGGARITKTFIGEGISWSPDGKSLAYIRNTNAPGAVMIRNVETGEERAYVQANVGLQQARWLPDSSGVVVFVRDPGARQSGHMYSLDLKSGEYRKLVQIAPGRSAVVALSPDGKSLYTSQKGTGTTELIAIELATGTERQVATFPNPSNAEVGLSISPDGSSLVVQTWADQANRLGRLLIARTDGSGRRDLLPSFPADRTLSILRWTSDGRSILYFTTAANGDWRLMRISPDGGQPEFAGLDSTRLTGTVRIPNPGPYSPLSMDASPDGTQIVFAYRPALRTELWSLDNVSSVIAARQ